MYLTETPDLADRLSGYPFALAGTTTPTPARCNERELDRRVNACIAGTKRCVFNGCTRQMALGLARCRGRPWCNARVAARYHRCLGRCRDRLMECDRRAKRDTGCLTAAKRRS